MGYRSFADLSNSRNNAGRFSCATKPKECNADQPDCCLPLTGRERGEVIVLGEDDATLLRGRYHSIGVGCAVAELGTHATSCPAARKPSTAARGTFSSAKMSKA